MNDQSYIEGIATIIQNYRRTELTKPLDAAHVERWVGQFAPDERSTVLAETFHVLTRYYFKEERILLAPGDRDHILSGVFNQFLSALTEPIE